MEEANIPIDDNEIKKSVSKKKSHTERIRENPWILSTVVLAILVLVMLISSFNGITGGVVSEKEIGEQALNFFNTKLSSTEGTLESVSVEEGLYEVQISVGGTKYSFYFTKQGSYVYQGSSLISTEEEEESDSSSAEVPKSDKPVVELFIWAYCPYGVQAQAPFAEVASLLGDSADFKVVPYYDGHGAYETQQNKIQACIQELYPDKYWDYALGFIDDIYPTCGSSRDIECDKEESINLMKSLGISSTEVISCVEQDGDELFSEASQRAKEVGVTGSPSLVINGVKVTTARTAEAFKTAVCEAFNDAPEECSIELSSDAGTASGNC